MRGCCFGTNKSGIYKLDTGTLGQRAELCRFGAARVPLRDGIVNTVSVGGGALSEISCCGSVRRDNADYKSSDGSIILIEKH